MKHGLLMSLVLGASAIFGAIGVPASSGGALTAAQAATINAPDTAPGVLEVALAPEDVAQLSAPQVQLAANEAVPVVGVSGAVPANGPGVLATAAAQKAIACSDVYLNFDGFPRRGSAPLTASLFCQTSFSDGNGGPTAAPAPVVAVQWFIGTPGFSDPINPPSAGLQTIDPAVPFDQQPFPVLLNAEGAYSVGMRVFLEDPENPNNIVACPPQGQGPFIKNGFFLVAGVGEDPPPANYTITDLICSQDTGGILPGQDWIPIVGLSLDFAPDQFAPRTLTDLSFVLVDQFDNLIDIRDIVEFGLFLDTSPGNNGADQVLNLADDGTVAFRPIVGPGRNFFDPQVVPGRPMLRWGSDGLPYEMPNAQGIISSNTSYNLNFTFDPTDPTFSDGDPYNIANPQFPFFKPELDAANLGPELNWVISWENEAEQWAYILAFRPSTQWPSGQQMRVRSSLARMQPYNADQAEIFTNYLNTPTPFGSVDPDNPNDVISALEPITNPPVEVDDFPFNSSGEPIDSYSPNFYQGEGLAEDCTLTSSFDVFDVTGGGALDSRQYPEPPGLVNNPRNSWNWPNKLYTPVAEHTRPRWDLGDLSINFLSGEWMDLRRVFSVEEWMPVIGLNMHATSLSGLVQLRDVNVILTDVGADPYGAPGNGGLDPRTGLDQMNTDVHGNSTGPTLGDLFADSLDYTFNGVGVFVDTGGGDPLAVPIGNCNGNGVFDPPFPLNPSGNGSGVGYVDLPLVPEALEPGNFQGESFFEWEYIPFPPGGGDPWWRMRMRFAAEGARGSTNACDGMFERTPDIPVDNADFFVVIRADSGFEDVSGVDGDGTGLPFGTDMRAFIEPRTWNPLDGGHWDGGINFTERPTDGFFDPDDLTVKYWQDQAQNNGVSIECDGAGQCEVQVLNNDDVQPWFHERTLSPDNAKPIRSGVDVHDYVLTNSSRNRYARESVINVGQGICLIVGDECIPLPPLQDPNNPGVTRTALSLWTDPGILAGFTGVLGQSFIRENQVGVFPDVSSGATQDNQTSIQYAYETVPFALPEDVGFTNVDVPLSVYYPNPATQPNLPDYTNWPQTADAVSNGIDGYCYLASEGAMANEPFNTPTSANSEKSYSDDEYIFVANDGLSPDVQPGMWLIDRSGGKFRILAVSGNEMTIQKGHNAYLDQYYKFRVDPITSGPVELSVPDWPFGIEVGPQAAVARGRWAVVRDTLLRNEYPRADNWVEGLSVEPEAGEPARGARILKQHVMQESQPTAMLGINVAGVADPVVNASFEPSLRSLTVAFWGPDFDPSDLAALDADGLLDASGVLLYEDSNGSGTYEGPFFSDLTPIPAFQDRIVPLQGGSLAWSSQAEPIDLDGDFQPDDMSGDGLVVFSNADVEALPAEDRANWDGLFDAAWVLRIQPTGWRLPRSDFNAALLGTAKGANTLGLADALEIPTKYTVPAHWTEAPKVLNIEAMTKLEKAGDKVLDAVGNFGDDLFVVVRTSADVSAFEQFRVVVPSQLPTRTPDAETVAGLEFSPRAYLAASSFNKLSPDEGAVQDFYGHDMLEVSVPTRVVDLSSSLTTNPAGGGVLLTPGGPATALLGIDAAANRPENLIAEGDSATVQANSFTTGSFSTTPSDTYFGANGWTSNVAGLYLLTLGAAEDESDARLEAFEITGASGNDLTLRAGSPAPDTAWQIVKDPSFLEQVIVEFYDVGRDGSFDLAQDLIPLNFEDPADALFSGVSLYRDNDLSPLNTNGVYDAPITDASGNVTQYIDLPVRLDDEPTLVGVAGEPEYQVRMVFSSPGTDNSTGRDVVAYESQPNLRQPVPQTFGRASSDPAFGSDFFVVVRTSRNMDGGDNFQAAVVSWGSDTPTEPDPDNFSVSLGNNPTPGQREDEFDLFSEFPSTARGLGFITFFQNPQPVRFWGYDQDTRKVVARTEVDRSQDNNTIRYWQRSTANAATRTRTVTALPSPEVDFTADRRRQAPGGAVQFTLLVSGSVRDVLWDFGDGTTSTATNPNHVYAQAGVYDVQVTVRDAFGIEDTVRKDNFIEILDASLADFNATPTDATLLFEETKLPPIGRDVSFVDLSIGNDDFVATSYFYNFGDGSTIRVATRPTVEAPLVHRYATTGFFTVTSEVTFTDNTSGATVTRVCRLVNYITIRACVGCPTGEGEGEGEGSNEGSADPPAADFTITNEIRDKQSLVPLANWAPLLNFTMGFSEDDPAPRILQTLDILLRSDGRGPEDLNYINTTGPNVSDLLEFGLFIENKSSTDGDNQELDINNDSLLYTWANTGGPVGTITDLGFGSIQYRLDFIGNGTPQEPQFPVPAAATTDDSIEGNSYIIAVRTSATWRSQITMRADVLGARMILPTSGGFPVNDEGAPIDSYSPNFYDNEKLEEAASYSSSFGAWSLTGMTGGVAVPQSGGQFNLAEFDSWANGRVLYTPLAEFSRPRWNQVGRLMDSIGGEFLELRSLVGQEQWYPVIGINAHSTKTVHIDDFSTGFGRLTSGKPNPQLTEVNIVLTDIGGDPFSTPGNGGFNPTDMLNRVTTNTTITDGEGNFASGSDCSFNGVWVWHDTDNDGIFDPPTPGATGGITMTGDKPMEPFFTSAWEYVPLPPGGGDPWWRIKLGFFGGTRRFNDDGTNVEGYLETTPDNVNPFAGNFVGSSEYTNDYFVVVRPDSGKQDSSSLPGDGSAMVPGADFKAFIEPRRFNPLTQQTDGGIYLDSMLPPQGISLIDGTVLAPWQDDARWGSFEPWWPQRTVNAAATQKVVAGVEVHDLAMTYETDSDFAVVSDLFYPGFGSATDHSCLGYSVPGDELTFFDRWADPFGLVSNQFLNNHTVGVTTFGFEYTATFTFALADVISDVITFALNEGGGQNAFETVPFNNGYDTVLSPRSGAYPVPPAQPTLPEYFSWSFEAKPGELPRLSQWDASERKARMLTQKTDIEGDVTAMLGINAVGSADPFVARNAPAAIRTIAVAFWGPDFKPSDLADLDPNGENTGSGVMLWEDADKSSFGSGGGFSFGFSTGTFISPTSLQDYLQFTDSSGLLDQFDKPVQLRNLQWAQSPELIDVDGDGTPDDMDGNGFVDQADRAWVVTISPKTAWLVPQNDLYTGLLSLDFLSCGTLGAEGKMVAPTSFVLANNGIEGDDKALDPTARNTGDDLFVTVRTSGKMSRFEKFRAVVPATLPERAEGQRTGGIQFNNMPESSLQASIKTNPDEDPEQDFYGHDTLEVNVPTRILDQTNQTQTVVIGGAATPTLALDLATNLDLTVDSGAGGVGSEKSFVVTGEAWAANAFTNSHWLIDNRYEAYQIVGNNATQLTLLSGTPRSGNWRIVKDPSFLEQLIVEFYNEGQDAEFNPAADLLPLNRDMEVSGIAIYRDNDNDPSNRNGAFDPGIDIPIALDVPPTYVGASGSDLQAKFVFAAPGTDDYAGAQRDGSGNVLAGTGVSLAEQPRHRQWVQDSFGTVPGDANSGADFFIVVRAGGSMSPNDNFRLGIVSWGPNTPSEPDPDTWASLNGPEREDFRKFEEFPWGQRGLGFVSFFGTPQRSYFMDGAEAKFRDDGSGVPFIRSHSTKKRRSGVVKAITRPVNATSLVIESATQVVLPPQVLPGETFQVVINGRGFGTRPVVNLSGYTVEILEATNTRIAIALTTPPPIVPVEPIVLIVRNPDTNDAQSRSDLFTLEQVSTEGPRVLGVNPARGNSNAFPVTVLGDRFPSVEKIQISFGTTVMVVKAVSADGKSAMVELPSGGLPGEGARDVTVSELRANATVLASDTLVNGFYYENNVVRPEKGAFFICAPGGPAGESNHGDWALIVLTLGGLVVITARRRWAK